MNKPNVEPPDPAALMPIGAAASSPEPLNPYAPPASKPARPRAARFPSGWLYGFIAAQVAVLLGDLAALAGVAPGELSMLLHASGMLVGVLWLRRQWARLPANLQMVKNRGVTPGQAAVRNLIPLYNLYWMFVVSSALCNGIDRMLEKKGREPAAPVALSVVCPGTIVLLRVLSSTVDPTAMLGLSLAGGVLWATYMVCVERALADARREAS